MMRSLSVPHLLAEMKYVIAFIHAHVNVDSHGAERHVDVHQFMDGSSDIFVSIHSTLLCETSYHYL